MSRRCLADPPPSGPRRLSAQCHAGSVGFGDHAHGRRGIRHGAAPDGRHAGVGHYIRPGLRFYVIARAALGRPRIDVTLRISGLFRDVFSTLPVMFEQAAAALAARDEPDEENHYRAAAGPRVFGPAPGDYGVGVVEAVTEFTSATAEDAGEAWLAASAFAYGGAQDGMAARPALEQRTAATDAFVHAQDLPEADLLTAPDYAAHEAGFAPAARRLGSTTSMLYHVDTTNLDAPRMRTLAEEIARVVRGRAANPRWLAGQMRHGFRGAAEIASTLDQMAN